MDKAGELADRAEQISLMAIGEYHARDVEP